MSSRAEPMMSRADRRTRRQHVLDLLRAGNPPSVVARHVGLTRDRVRKIGKAGRDPLPVPDAWLTDPVWEMEEAARKSAFARRAADGARAALRTGEEL